MADFDPRQLDQLEDALERLADHTDDPADHEQLEALDLPPEVLERLSEYRDVLALCRDAFPVESPPDDVLTVVLAEAREVSRRPRPRDAEQHGGLRRFWERWRGSLVPGLALAATAAVVLWVLDPAASVDSATELSTEKLDRPAERGLERTQPASESSSAELENSAEPTAAEPSSPDPATDRRKDIGAVELQQPSPKLPSPGGKPPSKSKLAEDDALEPEPEPTPMNKDETWTNLERADGARRTGDCDRARSIYEEVIDASSDAQAIARAKGGIGLCFEQDRRDSEATNWFNQARASSPGIDTWISSQRDEQPLPGETKKKSRINAEPFEADDANSL